MSIMYGWYIYTLSGTIYIVHIQKSSPVIEFIISRFFSTRKEKKNVALVLYATTCEYKMCIGQPYDLSNRFD